MKKFPGIAKRRRSLLLASAFAPVCFGIFIGGAGPSRPQPPPRSDIKIVNKTSTLEIVALETTANGHLIIRFKNISSKDLNGFAVAVNGARITGDISSGDRFVSPGKTEDLEIPMTSSPPELTVLAAMFTDGNIEGDPAIAAELSEWRLGLKKQLIRALSDLETTLKSPDVDSAVALDTLEFQFSSLEPDSPIESRNAGDTLNTEIQMLREKRQSQGAHMQRQHLLDFKGRIERRIASL